MLPSPCPVYACHRHGNEVSGAQKGKHAQDQPGLHHSSRLQTESLGDDNPSMGRPAGEKKLNDRSGLGRSQRGHPVPAVHVLAQQLLKKQIDTEILMNIVRHVCVHIKNCPIPAGLPL